MRRPGAPDAATGSAQRAAILHVLAEAERSGSTCLPLQTLLRRRARAARRRPRRATIVDELVTPATSSARASGSTALRPPSSRPSSPSASRELIARRAQRSGCSAPTSVGRSPSRARPTSSSARCEAAFAHRLSVITGGPGTGKTASIRTIAAGGRAPGRAGDAGRADRARRGPDERGQRRAARGPSTRRSAGSRARARRTTRTTRSPAIC